MTKAVILPARRAGKSLFAAAVSAAQAEILHAQAVDRAVLVKLQDLGGEVHFNQLWDALPVSKRDLYRSLARQHALGNVKRHHRGEPIALTAAARFAIEAGFRAAQQGTA